VQIYENRITGMLPGALSGLFDAELWRRRNKREVRIWKRARAVWYAPTRWRRQNKRPVPAGTGRFVEAIAAGLTAIQPETGL